jgi:hypothetical protein
MENGADVDVPKLWACRHVVGICPSKPWHHGTMAFSASKQVGEYCGRCFRTALRVARFEGQQELASYGKAFGPVQMPDCVQWKSALSCWLWLDSQSVAQAGQNEARGSFVAPQSYVVKYKYDNQCKTHVTRAQSTQTTHVGTRHGTSKAKQSPCASQ